MHQNSADGVVAQTPFLVVTADSDDAAHPFRDDGAQRSGMMPPG
jgi:hypothetical protein